MSTPHNTAGRRKDPSLKVLTPCYAHAGHHHQNKKDASLNVPTSTPYHAHAIQDHQMKRGPSLKVLTLTPHYAHNIQDHQKKKRPQPQGTHANALLCTSHERPPHEKLTASLR
jgi:hypothetical protein